MQNGHFGPEISESKQILDILLLVLNLLVGKMIVPRESLLCCILKELVHNVRTSYSCPRLRSAYPPMLGETICRQLVTATGSHHFMQAEAKRSSTVTQYHSCTSVALLLCPARGYLLHLCFSSLVTIVHSPLLPLNFLLTPNSVTDVRSHMTWSDQANRV